jgi:hypothetical protein
VKKKPDRKLAIAAMALLVGAATAAVGPPQARSCPGPESAGLDGGGERSFLKLPDKRFTTLGGQ